MSVLSEAESIYNKAKLSDSSEEKQARPRDCGYLRFVGSLETRMTRTPRSQTLDDGESRDEEVESETSVHC